MAALTEAQFQTAFGRWLTHGGASEIVQGGAAFELKVTKGKRLAMSAVAPHQIEALKRARGINAGAMSEVESAQDRKGVSREGGKQGRAFKSVVRMGKEAENEEKVLYHKISDQSAGFKPCDCFVVRRGGGWIVVLFNDEKNVAQSLAEKDFYLIDVADFLDAKERGLRSLHVDEDVRDGGLGICRKLGEFGV